MRAAIVSLAALGMAGFGSSALAQTSTTVMAETPGEGAAVTTTTTTTKPSGGAAAGAVTGAATGAVVGGPVGAAVGAVVGGVAGAVADPPEQVTTYVKSQTVPVADYSGQIVVGEAFPTTVTVYDVPSDPRYRWSYVNGQRVLIDRATGRVLTVLP